MLHIICKHIIGRKDYKILMQFCVIVFNYFKNCDKIYTICDRSEDKLNDKIIKSLIEKTLEELKQDSNYYVRRF